MTDPKAPTLSEAADAGIAELDADLVLTDEVDELVQGTLTEREAALARAQACWLKIQEFLVSHRCRINARFNPEDIEPVGLAGDKLQIRATYYIAPLP